MKQTAVEWLVEELNKSIGLTKFVDTCDEEYKQEILGIIEKALQREKEQREKDFINGYKNKAEMSNSTFDEISEDAAKELFKQTFKTE